jgi:hypothetical protein
MLSRSFASVPPESVILPQEAIPFKQSMNSYWTQQECEVIPACIIRPHDIHQLSTAVMVLKREYDRRQKQAGDHPAEGLFAIRSGGRSRLLVVKASGKILIDLSLLCEVVSSEDGSSLIIGAGTK